jgi:hypothetical protein
MPRRYMIAPVRWDIISIPTLAQAAPMICDRSVGVPVQTVPAQHEIRAISDSRESIAAINTVGIELTHSTRRKASAWIHYPTAGEISPSHRMER